MDLFRFIPGYHRVIFDEGKEPLFLLLLAFLVAFTSTSSAASPRRRSSHVELDRCSDRVSP